MFEDDDKDEFFFRWQIKNFCFATNKTGDALHSPSFVVDVLDETKWSLSVYPRGKEDGEFIDVFLTRCSEDGGGVQIPIIFTIELEAADSSRQERRVSLESIFERNSSWGFEQYIRRTTLLEDMKSTFLPDDILTIHCKLERAPSGVGHITEYIIESYAETVKTEVPWTIENWSETRDFSEVYKDAQFTGEHESSFRMFICESDEAEKNFILKLKKLESKKKDTYVSCRISVLDAEGFEVLVRTTHHRFSDASEMTSQKLCDRGDVKDSYLQDGTLSLRCVLNMETGKKTFKKTEKVHSSSDEDLEEYILKELVEDYENMFLSGNFSNVKLRAGSKVVDCHKSILYARSQVLGDLLDRAEESSEGGDDRVIDIEDVDGDTLEQMVYFMYSDKINNIKPASALKLFVAGHKYQIKYLKQKCSLYLSQIFNFENVYDVLTAAHICEDGELKRRAIGYISEYFSRICLTTEWANFRKTEKELAAYVCREIRRIKHL
ncbi:hypothetical protein AVEN_61869-1 [Araneus ventricosus]|uniref:Speckle-type POZ protein n=1 Tax=Araneus ventricosus TaxID=182803 RepID=A0A4Y2UL44_ARAVE|nr:hypothetical protein AVEN_61869-1 [Araneus ventricosus]